MKSFHEWLSERDPEMYDESWLKKAALGAAFLAGTAGVGAGLGVAAPYIGQARAAVADRVGDVIGVKNAGDATRARESTRKQLAKKVGGNAALGGLAGLGLGAAGIASLRKR